MWESDKYETFKNILDVFFPYFCESMNRAVAANAVVSITTNDNNKKAGEWPTILFRREEITMIDSHGKKEERKWEIEDCTRASDISNMIWVFDAVVFHHFVFFLIILIFHCVCVFFFSPGFSFPFKMIDCNDTNAQLSNFWILCN